MTAPHRLISFSKENIPEIIGEFQTLRNEIMESPEIEEIPLSKYLKWRGYILPFLSSRPQEGRHFLYSYPFILAFTRPQSVTTRQICELIIINVIDHEFTLRLKEIGETEERGH